jgi:aminoglycoside phosphotransferase (APT) family kinase protein
VSAGSTAGRAPGAIDLIAAKADALVARTFPGATIARIHPLEGGHSGQTLLAELVNAPQERAVIKSGAPGRPAVGRHDVLRQARLLTALAGRPGIRVPTVLGSERGEPSLFLMTYEPGECIEPVLDGRGAMNPSVVEARARSAARMLGHLHSFDPATVGLVEEPPAGIASELARWASTMSVVDQTLVIGATELLERLGSSRPAETRNAVVHGDYRLGNILYDGTTPTGIIDWEIWNVTDPRIDLSWFLLSCDADDFPGGVGSPAPGMPSTAELVAEYAAVVGTVTDTRWFLAFARFKMAAIMAHNLRRHREGRHHDPYQERLPPTIASLVRRGIAALEGIDGADQ